MDLRLPSGLFFTLIGLLLCAMGLFAPEARAPLTEININLYWGITLLAFGGISLWLSRRRS